MTEPGGEEVRVDVPLSHETTQPPYTVRSYTPAELDDDTLERLDLYKLITEGTQLTDPDEIKNFTRDLLRNDNPPTRETYVAEADGKAVGYMVLNKVQMKDADPLGFAFASWLYQSDPEFANAIWDSPETLAVVHGVTTDSAWRGQGVQRKLWEKMVQNFNPSIIIGESKNPAAVVARAKAIEPLGYKTFFGPVDVTPNSDENAPTPGVIQSLINTNVALHTAAGGEVKAVGDGLIQAPSEIFAAETPDMKGFPPVIQRAFQPVITAQSQIGEHATVVHQLISVKNSVLTSPTAISS